MPSFYARVTLNYSYAQKMIEEQKSKKRSMIIQSINVNLSPRKIPL